MRCTKCGHSWHQMPVAEPTPLPAAAAVPHPAMAVPQPAQAPEPPPAPKPEPAPPAPEPEPPEPDVESTPGEADALSPEDLNAMFGEDQADEQVDSLIDAKDSAEAEEDPDAMAEPDPIPDVFMTDDDDEDGDGDGGRKGSIFKVFGIVILAVLLIAPLVLYFGKDLIIDHYGPAEDLYKKVGLAPKVGAGLVIRPAKPIRETANGIEVLIFRGVIQNISKRPRPVPMIYAVLSDADQNVLQTTSSAPIKSELQPDERLKFKISVSYPAPLARDAWVTFKKPPEPEPGK